jgi:hypothetical protein
VPKIDWRDEDQPTTERFGRPQRRRLPLSPRPTPARRWDFGTGLAPIEPHLPAARRALHLIWGPPEPPAA